MLEDVALDASLHDRKGFDCGSEPLNTYLQRFASQHHKRGISVVRVLADREAPEIILGYFALSAAQVEALEWPDALAQGLPRHPVPCFRMGRFAVSARHQGTGLGKILMGCAVRRCLSAKAQVAAYALVVDAKDERARGFYEHYGFKSLNAQGMQLFLPLGGLPNAAAQ